MASIGEIVTQDQQKSLLRDLRKNASQIGYILPTVYRYASASDYTAQLYYKKFEEAYKIVLLASGVKNIIQPSPAGYIKFTNKPVAQTLGINVDFYVHIPGIRNPVLAPYTFVRKLYSDFHTLGGIGMVIKFYKTDGSGPFFTPIHTKYFGVAAKTTGKLPPEKIKAMDDFHRSCQIFLAKHNKYVSTLNQWAQRVLSPVEQKYFNLLNLKVQNMRQQIATVKGIELIYSENGEAIGIAPIIALYWLVGIVSVAAIGGWTIAQLGAQRASVDKVNAAFDYDKDMAYYELEVDKQVKAGSITEAAGIELKNKSSKSREKAIEAIKDLTQAPQGFMEQLLTLGKYALIFYGVKTIAENLPKGKN